MKEFHDSNIYHLVGYMGVWLLSSRHVKISYSIVIELVNLIMVVFYRNTIQYNTNKLQLRKVNNYAKVFNSSSSMLLYVMITPHYVNVKPYFR